MDRNNLFAKSEKTGKLYQRRIVYASFVGAENKDGHLNFNVAINKGKDVKPEYINHIMVRGDNPKRAELISNLPKGQPMLLMLSVSMNTKDGKEYTNYWLDSFSIGTGYLYNLEDEQGNGYGVVVGNLVSVNKEPYLSLNVAVNRGPNADTIFVNRILVSKNASENFIKMIEDLQKGQTVAIIFSKVNKEKDGKTYLNYYMNDLQIFPRKKKEE